MAFDLALGHTKCNWSRGSVTSSVAGEASKRTILGGMALAVAGGMVLIMSPWWQRLPEAPRPLAPKNPRHLFKVQHFHGGRMIVRPY